MNNEQYWTERNALVDVVRALTPGKDLWIPFDDRTEEQHEKANKYGAALDALKSFDNANGGTPVL